MKESNFPQNSRLVVQTPWYLKLVTVLLFFALSWGFFSIPSGTEDPVLRWLGITLVGIGLPYFLLMIFIPQTIFRDESFIHVNRLFMWKRVSYKNIKSLKILDSGDVKLLLFDGSSIQILCGTDQQAEVVKKIKSKVLNRLEP